MGIEWNIDGYSYWYIPTKNIINYPPFGRNGWGEKTLPQIESVLLDFPHYQACHDKVKLEQFGGLMLMCFYAFFLRTIYIYTVFLYVGNSEYVTNLVYTCIYNFGTSSPMRNQLLDVRSLRGIPYVYLPAYLSVFLSISLHIYVPAYRRNSMFYIMI
jgi:hypothetical protein